MGLAAFKVNGGGAAENKRNVIRADVGTGLGGNFHYFLTRHGAVIPPSLLQFRKRLMVKV